MPRFLRPSAFDNSCEHRDSHIGGGYTGLPGAIGSYLEGGVIV